MKNKLISIGIIIIFLFTSIISIEAIAPTPRVDLDDYQLTVTDVNNVYVTGTLSLCVGQLVGVYDSNGKVMYNFTQVGNSNTKESFKVQVPARYLKYGINTFKIKSTPIKNVINSSNPKTITITVKENGGTGKKDQIITASNLSIFVGETKNLNAKTSSGLALTYLSKDPSIASVDAKGIVSGRKEGTTNITIKQAGNNQYNPATKVISVTVKRKVAPKPTTYKIVYHGGSGIGSPVSGSMSTQVVAKGKTVKLSANKFKKQDFVFVGWARSNGVADKNNSTNIEKFKNINMYHFQLGCVGKYNNKYLTDKLSVKDLAKPGETIHLYAVWKGCGPQAAIAWGKIIASDNRFCYGTGKRAHHYGCFFCNSNKSTKHATVNSKWDRTTCCNPFISACYSHGANHSTKCSVGDMSYGSWTEHNNSNGKFKAMGKSPKLKPGDVFFSGSHVWMYAGKVNGKNYVIQAGHEGWDKGSVSYGKGNPFKQGKRAKGVLRYTPKMSKDRYKICNRASNKK